MSMAPDYLVEVRDRNFAVLGQIAPEFLNIQFTEVFRGVGAWQLKLPAEHPKLADLKAKGSGIVITQLSSGKVYSGRMRSAVLSQDAGDPVGTWLISGVHDNIIGSAVAVLPDPAHAADAQATSYWILSGDGETVMKSAVQLNAGSTAIASRKYTWLSVATNAHRGSTVKASERFKMLGEVLNSLGVAAGLGWRFYQSGAGIVFDVYQPADKTDLIQLDIRNGGLESTELGFSAPSATEVLVLGQGQGDDRTVRRVTSTDANAEAVLWGLRWESVKDQRNTDDPTALQQAGEEILDGAGTTVHSLKVVPSDAPNQRLGEDWDLGDIVTVVIDGEPAEATVTEVATSITSAGLIRTATVGDPVGFDWEAKISAKVRETDDRVSNLEKLVDSSPNGFVPAFADPNADRIVFWDDSAGAFAALGLGAPLFITGTTLDVDKSTDAEAIAQTLTTKVLTPSNLAAKGSSSAEALAGVLSTKFLTPASIKAPVLDRLTAQEARRIGLVPITPTALAVTGGSATGSVAADGLCLFSSASGVFPRNMFTGGFKRYRVLIRLTNGTGASPYVNMRWATAGVASSASLMSGGTSYRQAATTSTGVFQSGNSQQYATLGYAGSPAKGNFIELDIYDPLTNSSTEVPTFKVVSGYGTVNHTSVWGSWAWDGAGTFDGIWLYLNGTDLITGSLEVWGYAR